MVTGMLKLTMRQIRSSLTRFLAIAAIVALGVGFFCGLRLTKTAMVHTLDDYAEAHRMYDFRLVSTVGFDETDAEMFRIRELVKKDCTLDLHLSILKYQEQSIELTRNEFRILYYFFMNEDKVISKEELLEKLWNDKYYIDENVLLVNMTRLKKKMKEIGIVHLLENIRGKGWKL